MNLYSRDSNIEISFPQVMGILNVTPDSFFDGGKHNNIVKIIKYTQKMINDGASIIDVGGESTRPGADEISVEEELERVIPVIENIVKRFEVWVSIDTSKPEVILESARSGVHIINDVRSLSKPGALNAAVESGLPVCLVHMQGNPKTMQQMPCYNNIVMEVDTYLKVQIARCQAAGIKKKTY